VVCKAAIRLVAISVILVDRTVVGMSTCDRQTTRPVADRRDPRRTPLGVRTGD